MRKHQFLTMTLLFSGSPSFSSTRASAAEAPSCVSEASCDGTSLCASPEDTSAQGVFSVGAKTVQLQGLKVELWYPAAAPAAGTAAKKYDVRSALPLPLQFLIPAKQAPIQSCDCYEGLALDREHGPYPLIIFAHGSASFRTQSLSLMTHLASRGFVVMAADHPGLWLADFLQGKREGDVVGDLRNLIAGLSSTGSEASELDFLKGFVQLDRIGLVGHSAGGGAITALGGTPGVRMLVPMAAGGVGADFTGSSLILGGLDDKVVPFSRQEEGFAKSGGTSRLIGVGNAGHLAFADLCEVRNAQGQNLVELGKAFGLPGESMAGKLWDGCGPGQLSATRSMEIVRFAVTAEAEEQLLCKDRSAAWEQLSARYPEVLRFQSK